jgi:hypothetical protein
MSTSMSNNILANYYFQVMIHLQLILRETYDIILIFDYTQAEARKGLGCFTPSNFPQIMY